MILIIDNYDSFVFNVARYFEELGEKTRIVRNTNVTKKDLNAKAIIISPGPCGPRQAGQSMQIVSDYAEKLPILGICLGHQVIGEVFGASVQRALKPMHGDSSEITHSATGLFQNIPQRFFAGRYHSLSVRNTEHTPLHITATSDDGEVMAIQHRTLPIFGVQFHPESILTEHGYDLLRNFLKVLK
jgi:para-aminobenzoate synthetase component II